MAHIEIQRSNVTKAKFNADARFAIKKTTLAGWADQIDADLGTLNTNVSKEPVHFRHKPDAERPWEEIFIVKEGYYQSYFKPTPEGYAQGYTGYNFIYEFDYNDEKRGNGYLYIAEF